MCIHIHQAANNAFGFVIMLTLVGAIYINRSY